MLDRAWAAVVRAPADTNARRVLADLLLERGDPQGEFISLQIAAGDAPTHRELSEREAELLRKHSREWTPAGTRRVRFRRGLFADAVWWSETDPSHRGWLTLERLECGVPSRASLHASPFGNDNPLTALREVHKLPPGLCATLLLARPRPALRLLELRAGQGALEAARAAVKKLPSLRVLRFCALFGEDDALSVTLATELISDLGPRLERLRLRCPRLAVRDALALIARRAPALTLELVCGSAPRYAWLELGGGRARIGSIAPTKVDSVIQAETRARAAGLVRLEKYWEHDGVR